VSASINRVSQQVSSNNFEPTSSETITIPFSSLSSQVSGEARYRRPVYGQALRSYSGASPIAEPGSSKSIQYTRLAIETQGWVHRTHHNSIELSVLAPAPDTLLDCLDYILGFPGGSIRKRIF
jgi:hypothetical protein